MTFVAMPSSVTVAPSWNPVPIIVRGVPPEVEPVFGKWLVTASGTGVVE
jgi:hypothetical protein